ncbi:MAG: tRNA (N(6)-L-threonylcarbamoyladenosine(37)-C(2))-methylthiotransferase MtaB [Fimbriimonadales bacterium]|nr:MAG: tRNA (N(6)-L-threonylcarbamoyladenosine(37)-C(2))-methylthiotransferase MtaB [Fimbriimonadales bacterium]
MPTAAFTTLGCKVNQYETQKILESFEAQGFEIVPFDAPADVYVINTCSVTQSAEAKSRQTVRRAARQNPNAIVVMTGCYAQFTIRRGETLQEAHLTVPNPDKLRTVEYLLEHFPHLRTQLAQARRNSETPIRRRTRAVLKIQDGCNVYCSFCSIPYTRPVMRSTLYTEVLQEARAMVEDGYRELVLTGVLIGDYGPDTGSGGPNLTELCAMLSEIDGLERIRISSIEPTLVSDELIELIATNPKMCPQLHIPLQSGDSGVLQAMNRPYDQAFYLDLIRRLRARIPNCGVSTDIMVGFPGEDEAAFQNTCFVAEQVEFCRAHLFRYSPRPDTPAESRGDQVPDSVKAERMQRLQAVCKAAARRYAARFLGATERVLVESRSKLSGLMTGTSDHYLQVEFAAPPSMVGQLVSVRITDIAADGVLGELVAHGGGEVAL